MTSMTLAVILLLIALILKIRGKFGAVVLLVGGAMFVVGSGAASLSRMLGMANPSFAADLFWGGLVWLFIAGILVQIFSLYIDSE